MKVRVFFAGHMNRDFNLMVSMALAQGNWGKDALTELPLSGGRLDVGPHDALILAGGRNSICQFLEAAGEQPPMHAIGPVLVAVGRKKEMFSKDKTVVKVISGGDKRPKDGETYVDISADLGYQPGFVQFRATPKSIGRHRLPPMPVNGSCYFSPRQLAAALHRVFGV
jgi:hypothetical protein